MHNFNPAISPGIEKLSVPLPEDLLYLSNHGASEYTLFIDSTTRYVAIESAETTFISLAGHLIVPPALYIKIWPCASPDDMTFQGAITTIICSNTHLRTIALHGFSNLEHLNCRNNTISHLDLGLEPRHQFLTLSGPKLSVVFLGSKPNCRVGVSNSLKGDTLQISPTLGRLSYLDCSNNRIKALNLGICKNLTTLLCANNRIHSLDLRKLQYLSTRDLTDNPLETLHEAWETECPLKFS